MKATVAADLATTEAGNHKRDAQLKASQALEKEAELAEIARIAHLRRQIETDSRAAAEAAIVAKSADAGTTGEANNNDGGKEDETTPRSKRVKGSLVGDPLPESARVHRELPTHSGVDTSSPRDRTRND